jgi:hypothetical protein
VTVVVQENHWGSEDMIRAFRSLLHQMQLKPCKAATGTILPREVNPTDVRRVTKY